MIYLTKRAEKDLKALTPVQRRSVLKKLDQTDFSPNAPHVKKLQTTKGQDVEIYRLRTGVYRVLYTLEGEDVIILRIVHRKELEKVIKELLR